MPNIKPCGFLEQVIHYYYRLKVKVCLALCGTPSLSYGVSLVIWDHLPPDTTIRAPPNPSQSGQLVPD